MAFFFRLVATLETRFVSKRKKDGNYKIVLRRKNCASQVSQEKKTGAIVGRLVGELCVDAYLRVCAIDDTLVFLFFLFLSVLPSN